MSKLSVMLCVFEKMRKGDDFIKPFLNSLTILNEAVPNHSK